MPTPVMTFVYAVLLRLGHVADAEPPRVALHHPLSLLC